MEWLESLRRLAKQVLSQLSYTPLEETRLILKHFPIFCLLLFMVWLC